jgi:hypothetical protein
MEIRDVPLTKTGKIVTVNIGDDSIKATLIDRGVNIKEKNNIYLSFITEKVELSNDLTESISNYEEKEEAFLRFCGKVTSVEKIPPMSIDKYTKNIQSGYFIKIKVNELVFDIELSTFADSENPFIKMIAEKSNLKQVFVPKVGDSICGDATVFGVLF